MILIEDDEYFHDNPVIVFYNSFTNNDPLLIVRIILCS